MKLRATLQNAESWPGGLGAHGSNPCTPTKEKACFDGLSSFMRPVDLKPFWWLDQVLEKAFEAVALCLATSSR